MMRQPWVLVAVGCGALLAAACGGAASGVEAPGEAGRGGDDQQVGGSESDGGTSPGGAGGDGGSSGAGGVVSETPLEPGTCGIVRTLQLPQPPEYLGAAVTRQGTSYVLGPWKLGDQAQTLRAFVVEEQGESRFFDATGSTNDASWSTFLAEPNRAVEVFVTSGLGGSADSFDSRIWNLGDDTPRLRGDILQSTWRGTDGIALVPTLDGQRALFAIWPHGLSEPRAAVVGEDGARQGEPHTFAIPDESMRCTNVTPTAHGGFVSFVDSNRDLRVSELGAEGELLREVTWPMPSEGWACPSFTLAEGGLAFLLDRAPQDAPAEIGLYRLDEADSITEIDVPLPKESREVAMLGDDPLVLRWSSLGAELSRPLRGGELWPLTLPSGSPKRVASEPGNIVLDFDTPEEGRTVVQVSCR